MKNNLEFKDEIYAAIVVVYDKENNELNHTIIYGEENELQELALTYSKTIVGYDHLVIKETTTYTSYSKTLDLISGALLAAR